jgi:hypothetical protein
VAAAIYWSETGVQYDNVNTWARKDISTDLFIILTVCMMIYHSKNEKGVKFSMIR